MDKLVQFALKGHLDVLRPIFSFNCLEFCLVSFLRPIASNEGVLSSKEVSKDLKVLTVRSVTAKFVNALLNSIFKRIFPILVVYFAQLHVA